MYRLVLYYLIILLCIGFLLSFFGLLGFSPLSLFLSVTLLTIVSYITNKVFSFVFKAPTNIESVYITALILSLIITPQQTVGGYLFLGFAALLAMASKYIFALHDKHIFNPAAIAVVLTAFGLTQSASWWVGDGWLMPFVIVGGLLITRKIRSEELVLSFMVSALVVIACFVYFRQGNIVNALRVTFLSSPFFFFGFVMLTEPLTTPSTKTLQVMYGALIGVLFAPDVHIGTIYSTPELALVISNIFSYLISPKQRVLLKLIKKELIGLDIIEFYFNAKRKFNFKSGQYVEITLPHPNPDSRGNRRYFTIASSPTEDAIQFGIKFSQNGSTFKKQLANITNEVLLSSGQLAGDFILPKSPDKKLVFIAGGIGVTPFRSMIKYLVDKKENRSIVFFYANKLASEIMYEDVFSQAQKELEIKTVYTLTDEQSIPSSWNGKRGRISSQMILEEVPDYKERMFYLSGPHTMVKAFENMLKSIGVHGSKIMTDFFPGYN